MKTDLRSHSGARRILSSSWSILIGAGRRVDAALDHYFWAWAIALTVLLLACSIVVDLRQKMWVDELYTLTMAQQPSAAEIIRATWEGCDGMPPLYAIVVHFILPWIRSEELAIRLPATIGFGAMFLCLVAFCRRRMPASYAMTAGLTACYLALPYSSEGRGYGIVVGCAAAALLCWQLAIEGRHRNLMIALFALALALMTAMHYYALFFVFPFVVAEVLRWKTCKKLDWPLLVAMTPVALVLALHYPLISASAKFQKHYWSPVTWGTAYMMLGDSWTWIVVNFALFFLLLLAAAGFGTRSPKNVLRGTLQLHEWVALGTFFILQPMVVILSIYTTHVFVHRYVLWVVPALAAMLIALICAAVRRAEFIGVGLLVLLLTITMRYERTHLFAKPLLYEGQAVSDELVRLPKGADPVVIADHHIFMELSHYAAPPVRDRLLYLVSADLDDRYLHYDTGALLMSALRHRSSLHIMDLNSGLAEYNHFFVAAKPADYLPAYLAANGYHVRPLQSSARAALYEVERGE